MYTPPVCGTAKFYLGEVRPNLCTNIVFKLIDTFDHAVMIHDALSIALSMTEPSVSLVIPNYTENTDMNTTFEDLELITQVWYAQSELCAPDLTLNPPEIDHRMIYSYSERASADLIGGTVQYVGPLVMTQSEILTLGVGSDGAGLGVGPLFPPSFIKDNGNSIVWGITEDCDTPFSIPYIKPEPKDVPKSIPWDAPEFSDAQFHVGWISGIITDVQKNIPWEKLNDLADKQVNTPWDGILPFKDIEKRLPWGEAIYMGRQVGVPYTYPVPKDNQKKVPWEGSCRNLLSTQVGTAFTLKVPYKDTQKTVRWGPRDLTWTPCEPGSVFEKPSCVQINRFRLDEDHEANTGICQDVTMVLQCDNRVYNPHHYHHTGNRDFFYVPPLEYSDDDPTFGEDFYIVENTILVKRISDNEPIDVTAVSCRIDKGSWLWDFSLTITDEETLDLLKPYKSGNDTIFHDIEISINQNTWACRVERWNESRVFGKDSWTLTGRSPSSELTEPFSIPESFLSQVARQGGDMVEAVLTGTGWEAQWGYADDSSTYSDYINPFTDWLIPEDGYSYSDLVKIKGIQDIVEGIGAFIQTKADCHLAGSKKLIIVPNYVEAPWLWSIATADVTIPEALCKEISRSFESYKRVDGIVVSGVDHGVVVNATRMGLAGTTYAPMITHPLITTQEAGSERARSELAKTGMWSTHTLNLFSLKVPGSLVDPVTRLILPGELVHVTEKGSFWKGQASGTTVTGTVSTDGVKDVMQSITVEEYIG